MGYPGTYALAYEHHLSAGTLDSGTVGGMSLTPMVFSTVSGELDVYWTVWYRAPYVAKYVEIVLDSSLPITVISAWRVLVYNHTHSRWEQTPCRSGWQVLTHPVQSAVDLHGDYVELCSDFWQPNPEASSTSLTAIITSEHIDAQGRCAVRLSITPGVNWIANGGGNDYQVSVRTVRGCRSMWPLPKTYQVELSGYWPDGMLGTYVLDWQPSRLIDSYAGAWVYEQEDAHLLFRWKDGGGVPGSISTSPNQCDTTAPVLVTVTEGWETIGQLFAADPSWEDDVPMYDYLRNTDTRNPRTITNWKLYRTAWLALLGGGYQNLGCRQATITAGSVT